MREMSKEEMRVEDNREENPFRRALELMNKRGWTQGWLYNEDGYCSLGALAYSIPLSIPLDSHLMEAAECQLLAEVIKANYPDTAVRWSREDQACITVWNDDLNRTFAEVEAMFEKAAVKWDEEHG